MPGILTERLMAGPQRVQRAVLSPPVIAQLYDKMRALFATELLQQLLTVSVGARRAVTR